ncbi:MAG TPA: PKD domain-containing protein [Pseudolysinimonas sp.]|nr:PKD domain-containing protein [Pseudolysinimonas sp.]
MQITPDCVDPLYAAPIIDAESDESSPAPHHRVSGHFEGTNIQFTIYLPPADAFEGRFFQYTYPVVFAPATSTALADDRAIGFALASGGYAVQAGNASVALGYRHTAAAAKFAEQFAAEYYGWDQEIFGYLFGPSGGSFQTVGAAENTSEVWDGFMPLVLGTPMSNPYDFTVRAAAALILSDKADQISDAVLPGGSGDPFAGLDAGEAAMLEELLAFGTPLQGWENPQYLLGLPGGLSGFLPPVGANAYVDAFWNAEGYLGTEDSPLGDAVRAALATLGDTPENRADIASRFSYRHQLPAPDSGYVGFDQFRDESGDPLYPQIAPVWGPIFTGGVGGNTAWDGSIDGKMMVLDNLYDVDALPYHADWYSQRVEASLGSEFPDRFRVYYTDHADHLDAPVESERARYLINWYGAVEQALRDLAAWVEDGVAPPASTQYEVQDGQVVVPDDADERLGLQPTVDLTVRGGDMVAVKAGQQVVFQADVEAPPGTGVIVATAWDFEGDGTYSEQAVPHPRTELHTQARHRFETPGVYFVALRVTSQRDGVESLFAQVQNLDRVRVVVTP